MPQAAKTFDPVIGVDIHLVMVPTPGGPVPVPLPHPFIGFVWDPVGAAVSAAIGAAFGGGPVFVNGLDAASAGTDVKALVRHFPMPPGTSFAPSDVPDNKGAFITGSDTVTFGGFSASRTGSLVSSCNFPVNVPTSTCIAIPAGSPTLIGGAESVNAMSAVGRGIQTKWFSGLLNKLLKPGPRLSKLICFLTGHPVDVMTGEVLTDAVDFELPGPLPLRMERNYYSRSRYRGPLGQGWTHSLDMSVTEAEAELVVRLADGRERTHDVLKTGKSLRDDVDRYELAHTADGYRLTTWDGIAHVFTPTAAPRPPRRPGIDGAMANVDSPTHRLASITDRCGNRISLAYDSGRLVRVDDSTGRRIEVRWTREGRLEGMYFDARPLVRYTHDEEGMLSSAIDPAGNAATYGYQAGLLVRETNRNGFSFHFEYDWYDPDGWCVRTWGDGGLYERTLLYDKHRHITIVDDGRGGRTQYFAPLSGAAGLVDKIIDPMGVEICFEWSTHYRKVAEIDGLGHRTEWAHDERGNTILEKDATGVETRRRYNALNLPVEVTDPGGATWHMDYDHRGKLTRLVDPAGAERRYWHDARGLLVETEDPHLRKARFEYAEAGELVAATDTEGATTRYAWDTLGRLIRHTDPMGRVTRLAYDACGRVTGILRPDETTVRFSHDAEGNLTERIDPLGHPTRYRYAGFNKLVEQTDPAGYSVRYLHDVEEDLIGVVNEHGEKYTVAVDKAGRVTREVGFDGRTLLFRYDRAGRCNETTDAEGRITKVERDPLGRIVKRLVPRRPTLFAPIPAPEIVDYGYDARGDLVLARNDAAEVKLERDVLGRVVREVVSVAAGGGVVGSSRAASAAAGGGGAGPGLERADLERSREEARAFAVESTYSAAGDRVRRTTSLGHVTDYDIDGRGLLRGVVLGTDLATIEAAPGASSRLGESAFPLKAPWPVRITRDPDGAERSRSLPGGVTQRWERDAAGRPAVQRLAREDVALLGRGYQWRTEEQLAAIIDTAEGPTRYDHDPRGFLIAAHAPGGHTQHRSPDAIGNLYKAPAHTDRLYGHGGRIQLDGETRYLHDRDGNLARKIEPGGGEWRHEWDGAGQLARVTRPDGKLAEYAYDALGRRVRKTFDGATTFFVWDGNDLVHEIADDRPAVTWLFEPGTFAPMAKVEGHGTASEKRWAIVTDHLGTPIALIDELGYLAWQAQLDIFGVAAVGVAKTDCPWRWPGQYEDAETGLYYNRFRYYDPGLGRYVSQDPIGLAGSLQACSYVHDPLCWIDPYGLASCKAKGKANLRDLGLATVELSGKSYNSGRKALQELGFELVERTATGRRVFVNIKTGARVFFDSGKALTPLQKPHWHIVDIGGRKFSRSGRILTRGDYGGHIPAG